jgi:hypothetical protein
MVDRLRVTELDFDTIKNNLKNFLKQQNEFQDYDFEGSGLNILLDILAYNTHYNAYYLNMVANESFLDTALLRDSVVSHAKTLGYVPFSKRAPVATINLTVESNTTTSGTCTLPEGFAFLSNQIDSVAYNFIVLNDTTVTKSNTQYVFENLPLHEGQLVQYNFTYDQSSNPKQIFLLPDSNIDTTTIKVSVAQSSTNTSLTVYTLVTDVLDITAGSEIYFLQEEKSGRYQIYFGNDVVGKSLSDGSIVYVTYLVTNGDIANKANNFVATASIVDSLGNSLSDFTITPVSGAAGGSDRESVDRIKFSAASRFSTQNRLVTFKDYESYILNNYPNIDSISVWGGEDNDPPVYGKVFISLKPKQDYFISETEKTRIIDEIVVPKSIISVSSEIVDPNFLYLILESHVEYNPNKTTRNENQIRNAIRAAILSYKTNNLDRFSSRFVDSKIENYIDNVDLNAINGNDLTTKLQKRFLPTLGSSSSYKINFNVPLKRGTTTNKLTTTEFSVRDETNTLRTVTLDEVVGSSTGVSTISVVNPGFGYITAPTVTITGDGAGATAEAVIVNGKVEKINVTNRGLDYTRAIVTLSGGSGIGATAAATIDARTGSLRTIYYDVNAQRRVVNSNVGTIDYDLGTIEINDINIISVNSVDGFIRLNVESEEGIIQSVRNTILTIDEDDPTSIIINLSKSIS